ncbi:MAG: hypothetical protein K2M07_01885 [Muribaculaceae bacterium]|nr:hypothetical protein [Muribaculaceae bacterium]
MMKPEVYDRILDCRYYNGENNPPAETNTMFWNYEHLWARGTDRDWECEKDQLKQLGLWEWLHNNDGTPAALKCLLFNRYCHWIGLYGQPEGFIRWYSENYVEPALTNRQRKAIISENKSLTKQGG